MRMKPPPRRVHRSGLGLSASLNLKRLTESDEFPTRLLPCKSSLPCMLGRLVEQLVYKPYRSGYGDICQVASCSWHGSTYLDTASFDFPGLYQQDTDMDTMPCNELDSDFIQDASPEA